MKKFINNIMPYAIILIVGITITAVLTLGFINPMSKGDINRDGKVDAIDLSIVQSNWTDKAAAPKSDSKAIDQPAKDYLPTSCEKLEKDHKQWYECDI